MLDYVFETSISWKLLIASECRELDQKCCDCTLRSAESALAPLAASDMSKMFYTAGLSASAARALRWVRLYLSSSRQKVGIRSVRRAWLGPAPAQDRYSCR